jgi:hypothetical protein
MLDINEILARPEHNASSPHGAQMGRRNQVDGEPEKLHLQRIRFVDGDYDTGGAYWGGGRDSQPIYCAFSPEDTTNDTPIMIFVRAKDRTEAKRKVLEEVNEDGFTFADDVEANEDILVEMVQAYVTTALWSSNDNSNDQGGEPLDSNYSYDDMDPKSLANMTADCKAFIEAVRQELPFVLDEADPTDLGHDFWLTRNGHGCGFWDGDYDWLDRDGIEVGHALTRITRRFGGSDLEVGDDGKVYEI